MPGWSDGICRAREVSQDVVRVTVMAPGIGHTDLPVGHPEGVVDGRAEQVPGRGGDGGAVTGDDAVARHGWLFA